MGEKEDQEDKDGKEVQKGQQDKRDQEEQLGQLSFQIKKEKSGSSFVVAPCSSISQRKRKKITEIGFRRFHTYNMFQYF